MPELPEVERVRQSVARRVLGRKVVAVRVQRADVVRGHRRPTDLLSRGRIVAVERLGKQLALVADDGRCVCVHLGMSGSLIWSGPGLAARQPRRRTLRPHANPGAGAKRFTAADPKAEPRSEAHVHLSWRLDDRSHLSFRDPRRFGGLWTFRSLDALHAERWHRLGDDALRITPARLHRRLGATRRSIKAALLDQQLIAGLGNIYVDELLFACRLHPARPADTLALNEVRALVRHMRTLLRRSIDAGGSSLRDYVDAGGSRGTFQQRHRVYGRAGLPCRRCRAVLATTTIAGRTSVFCTSCQMT